MLSQVAPNTERKTEVDSDTRWSNQTTQLQLNNHRFRLEYTPCKTKINNYSARERQIVSEQKDHHELTSSETQKSRKGIIDIKLNKRAFLSFGIIYLLFIFLIFKQKVNNCGDSNQHVENIHLSSHFQFKKAKDKMMSIKPFVMRNKMFSEAFS